MLTTIRAEIDLNGQVHLLEKVEIKRPCRALVTILDEVDDIALNETTPARGTVAAALAFLQEHRLPADSLPATDEMPGNARDLAALMRTPFFANRPGYPAADMEAYIEEARNSWE